MDTLISTPLKGNELKANPEFNFMSIEDFKQRLNVESIDIIKSPTTGKLFAATPSGNFKVQGAIDFKKPIRFMYASSFQEGCITNVTESVVAVL